MIDADRMEETPEPPAQKMTPTERIFALGMAAMTRPTRPSTQTDSRSLKQVATGDLKGKWICDDLTIPRREDETIGEWNERTKSVLMFTESLLDDVNIEELRLARQAESVRRAAE